MQHCNKYQNNQNLSLPSGSDILPIYWSCRASAIYDLPINLRYIHKRVPSLQHTPQKWWRHLWTAPYIIQGSHQTPTETCSQVEPRARTAPCRPLLCIFKKAFFDIWTTGCISLYCLTDAEVGPLRLCFCSVSGTLEFSRLLLSSGPLDSWILDAAQYQQLYIMIIFLIYNTWCTILFFCRSHQPGIITQIWGGKRLKTFSY